MGDGWEEQSSHCWPKGQRQKDPSFGGLSRRWTGSSREMSVQGKSYRAITTEKVVEVSGSGILDSVFDKEEKILSFDVKTPICKSRGETERTKTPTVKPTVP